MLAVGGLRPEVTRSKDPRKEETLMMRASEDVRRSGRKSSESMRMEMTFTLRVWVQMVRLLDGSGSSKRAIPALLMRTGRLVSFDLNIYWQFWTNHLVDRISFQFLQLQLGCYYRWSRPKQEDGMKSQG